MSKSSSLLQKPVCWYSTKSCCCQIYMLLNLVPPRLKRMVFASYGNCDRIASLMNYSMSWLVNLRRMQPVKNLSNVWNECSFQFLCSSLFANSVLFYFYSQYCCCILFSSIILQLPRLLVSALTSLTSNSWTHISLLTCAAPYKTISYVVTAMNYSSNLFWLNHNL